LDLEFPDAADKANFAAWVKELKAAFAPGGYEVIVLEGIMKAMYHHISNNALFLAYSCCFTKSIYSPGWT